MLFLLHVQCSMILNLAAHNALADAHHLLSLH
jgi:hypothetical protein